MPGPVQGIGGAGQLGAGRIDPSQRPGGAVPAPGAAGEGGTSFSSTLKQALGEVSSLQEDSQNAIQSFLRGEAIELHQVMAAAEEAGIALEMLVELRNKLTEAYRSVMQMQT